ncbi:PucR family transcriptional regulator [Micromonospora sp. DT81.3]|uniref:PucR family transcriptional regulator n=1 Tax=Micromonospora sp. DT81.3 TaxID=3416523 RepID=UPI003CF7763D
MAEPPESATLRALLLRADLALRLQGELSALENVPVRWVHSSDLVDPTPFLSEGLLLLTTGTQFVPDAAQPDADSRESYDAYVRRLRARGVAGLGFGTEVVRDGIPPLLVDACAAHGIPLFEVPYRTPFIAVARANAEAIAAEAYARRSWALAAQRAISLAALRPDGLGASLAELARQLGTWVGLYDTAGSLARSFPEGQLEEDLGPELAREAVAVLRGGARAASSTRIRGRAFTLQTLGRGGHLRGVMAIASEGLDQAARGVVTSVIAMAGLALEQTHDLARARGMLRAGLVQSLLSDDPRLARRVARELWGGLPAAPIVVGLVTDVGRNSDAIAAFLDLRAGERQARVFFGRGDEGLVICVEADDVALIEELAAAFGLAVGVSEPAGYDAFARAYREARLASAEGPGVTRFGALARRGVLAAAQDGAAREVARATLAPLEQHDAAHGTSLAESARVWLEHDANGDAAAKALGIHRHTLRARISLIERLLHRDLRGFAARADLWAALQLSR